jgi:hypothetical protein
MSNNEPIVCLTWNDVKQKKRRFVNATHHQAAHLVSLRELNNVFLKSFRLLAWSDTRQYVDRLWKL